MIKIPRGDKTGPEGKGPKTGRGLGDCNKDTKLNNKRQSRNFGRGRGQRQGFGRRQN